ncbi:porin [Xenophilus sp. Marseille-Q4582]|uniref:porin n=1 Tax=Xenophilus sp. Marseille-Q4582 TaxID=2866600 RepID=UPI001CE41FA0|nr:porin [Xenophilus sp. Marseille-Q4582]
MKKTLAALAALALCGVASAQSSVTLFGVVDVAVSNVSNKAERVYTLADLTRPSLLADSIKVSRTELRNSGLSSSRLGFRGVEDLGGGLTAGFWLESPLTNDDGGGLSAFSRRSTVSLAGGFGELRLGRDSTPTKLNDDQFDPFGATGIGASLIATAYSHSRVSNSVQYFLPRGLGGVYGNVMYAFHERSRFDPLTAVQRDSKAGQFFGGRIGFANGPLDVAVAYGQLDGATVTTDTINIGTDRTTKNKILSAGATYDFGVVKLFGQYSQNRTERSTLAADYTNGFLVVDPKTKVQGYLLGVSVPVGAGLIRASYAHVKYDDNTVGTLWNPVEDRKANKFALGYQHNLSKRTALYATVARVSNKNGAALTVGGPALTAAQLAPAGATYRMKNSTGYEFGLRHSF